MPSSFRVIKNNSIAEKHEKVIETNFEEIKERAVNEGNARTFMESYESLSKSMIENARRQSRDILLKAYEEADNTIRNADDAYKKSYEKGYTEGSEKGYNDAYEEAYRKNIKAAGDEIENMKQNAENMLSQARKEYDDYLTAKEDEIRNIIFEICKGVLKQEVKEADALNNMILSAISEIKGGQTIIIRCHPNRSLFIKEEIEAWKKQSAFSGDLFVIGDASVEEDSVVIEKENGKITTGIDAAISKIKEIVYCKPN